MSRELDKAYDPSKYEAKIYTAWEASGAFQPNMDAPKDPFTIIMPPPNANGNLHLGHAMYVIEDIMVRYRRMQGHKTLWLPGADHAGIETQMVYERLLAKEGKTRFDLGRQEFYNQVDTFTKQNMDNMINQVKALGFSVDWSRLKYTLDDDIIATVYNTFKELHEAGLVYRANRIVNWCPNCRSAFADIEVKYREQQDPLYYLKYGPFVLATVRPETKFGDTAVAVNPKDERYAKYVGTEVEAESVLGHTFKIRVIADEHVDPAFGTGAVKVTPAHDPNDWEMGLRHNLEVKQVIGTDGRLTELAGKYAGMTTQDARAAVAADMEARGLMDHIDANYTHSVGYHDRCGTLMEPLVVEQWWLKVDELKKPAIEAIKSGEIKFVPERFTKVALDWLENLRDWNISRQNWWGIRVPVYYNAGSTKSSKPYIVASKEAEAVTEFGEGHYEAETDNFDTWFSSGQWPFATTMATGDFDQGFYPTSVMETGRDILFLWVTRMIMFGLFKTGKVPFKTVYLHGLVTDGAGKKMSKSKGNVINPLDMTKKYGTDALRLALTIGITAGNDGPLSERKIEGYRNFNNKLWNVARFILGQLPETYVPAPPKPLSPADHWILSRLNSTISVVTEAIEEYRFSDAGTAIYSLLWDDFADWYLEASKVSPNHEVLMHTLQTILKLLHPIAPFVSEAIWEQIPGAKNQLIVAHWPVADTTRTKENNELVERFTEIKTIIAKTRTYLAKIQPQTPVLMYDSNSLENHRDVISKLTRLNPDQLIRAKNLRGFPLYLGEGATLIISTEEATRYRAKLQTELDKKLTYKKAQRAKLANQNFVQSAPRAVVEQVRESIDQATAEAVGLGVMLAELDERQKP